MHDATDRLSVIAGVVMVGFLVWLCAQMAITDWKADLLALIGVSTLAAVAALAAAFVRR